MDALHLDLRVSLPEWHLQAACRGMDPGLFFPEVGWSTGAGKAVCVDCPVSRECLDYAVTELGSHAPGIWGGTNERERRPLRKGAA